MTADLINELIMSCEEAITSIKIDIDRAKELDKIHNITLNVDESVPQLRSLKNTIQSFIWELESYLDQE